MKFEFYREDEYVIEDGSAIDVREGVGDWRWRLRSNGRIVAEGGEGYRRIGDMLNTLRSIFKRDPVRLEEIEKARGTLEKK